MTRTNPDPETSVPANEEPPARCPYCDRPFRTDRLRALHVGEDHGERCTEGERAAYQRAWDEEDDDLFYYHLKVVGGLALTWAGIVLIYMVALGAS